MPRVIIVNHNKLDATGPTHAGSGPQLAPVEPLTVNIAEACRITGISRSELYRRLAAEQVRAIKSGARTLILMDSLRQHLASLPYATFRTHNK